MTRGLQVRNRSDHLYKIAFGSETGSNSSEYIACPICKGTAARPVLTVEAAGHLPADLDLVECAACKTMYFLGDDPVLGYDFAGFSQEYWYRYVQNGAGISAMLEPLLAIGGPRRGDLLDVGCGFGFTLDFWQKSGFGQSVGLETSAYGKVGREKLGVDIIASYYDDAKEIAERKFDYVFSSEVIEHVRDPKAFIQDISRALKPGGILVLTTPCADGISSSTDLPNVIAILSPGFHYFITRAEALCTLLESCGFAHVLVRKIDNRLLCWASHSPLPEISEGFQDWEVYLSYLEILSKNPDPHVASGALYRLLKDAINLGKYDIARRAYPAFEAMAKSVYKIDFLQPGMSVDLVKAGQSFGTAEVPSWTGCGYLFAGRLLELEGSPPEQLVAIYSAAIEAMQQEAEKHAQFAQEAHHFLPMAHAHLSKALVAAADRRGGNQSVGYPTEIGRNSALRFQGREVCLFVTYVPGTRLLPGARALVQALAASGLAVVVCCAVNDMSASIDLDGLEDAALVLKRKNGGYDFAVWAAVLARMPELWSSKRLVFVNDSILGPLAGLDQTLQRIRASDADFLALTESYDIRHHSQSYFFVLQNRALSNVQIRSFWRDVRVEKTKQAVIEKYEVGMLSHVREIAGLKAEILFSYDFMFPGIDWSAIRLQNPTHHLWEHLVSVGFPFVKAELLHTNPIDINIDHWPQIVALRGGDVDLFRAHLTMMDDTRGFPAEHMRFGKMRFLRRMIGDDLFFELSEILAIPRKLRR